MSIQEEVAALEQLSIVDLRARFAATCGFTTTSRNRTWLIRRIAWKLQAQAEGGLSQRALAKAAELANARNSASQNHGSGALQRPKRKPNRNSLRPSPPMPNVGAVTWGSGVTGVKGVVTAANSLIGSTAYDMVGIGGVTVLSNGDDVTVLTNGNYVVTSALWDSGAMTNVGPATWGSGTTGVQGTISAANSLVGSTVVPPVVAGLATAHSGGADSHPEGVSYRFTRVDTSGRETPASSPVDITVPAGDTLANNRIIISNLPGGTAKYPTIRVYRATGNSSTYSEVGSLTGTTIFHDDSPSIPAGASQLDSATLTGTYSYLVTYFNSTTSYETRPGERIRPVTIVNGRISITDELPNTPHSVF